MKLYLSLLNFTVLAVLFIESRLFKIILKWVVGVCVLCALSASATIIPADRVPGGPTPGLPWNGIVGIPGGIPNRTTIFANVRNAPYNAKGDDVTDDTAAIQSAINACPSNQVVYVPTGTYLTTATLQLTTGVTVRGDGPGATTIDSHGSGQQVFAMGDNSPDAPYINYPERTYGRPLITPVNITSGTSLGSSNITVATATGIAVGQMVNIDVLNDTNGFLAPSPIGIDGFQTGAARDVAATRCLGQVCLVVGLSGNVLTIDPPLMWYMTNSPMAVTFARRITMAGIENMTLNDNNQGSQVMVSLASVSYCWVKNVETEWSDRGHISFDASARCEVRDGYMHDSYTHQAGGFEATSYLNYHSSGILFENNIIRRLHAGLFPNSGGGNVIAYNFITNQFDSSATTWMFNDIECHSAHPMMNLFEGNVMTGVSGDGIWGTSSHFTFLRNYISAQNGYNAPSAEGSRGPETAPFTRQTQNNVAMGISGFATNKYWNIVGNVLGSSVVSGSGQSAFYMTIPPATQSAGQGTGIYMFMLGYQGAGDICGCAVGDNNVPWLTLINHGNWDAVSSSQLWSNNISDFTIPSSYYLSSKPTFFGSLPWPPINPTQVPQQICIPAQARFYSSYLPTYNTNNTLLQDTQLGNNVSSLLTPSVAHIRSQGNYAGFAVRLTSNLGNDAGLYVYNQQGRQIQQIAFPAGIYTNVGVNSDIALFGSTCVLAGGSPVGRPGSIYEVALGNQTPLPTSMTLVTNFNVGDSQAQRVAMVKHSGGGVACFFNSNSNALWTCYRFPSGVWTNYGSVALPGVPNSTTFLTAAEQLSDHSIWVFFNNDASGKMSCAQFLTNSSGLVTNKAFQYVDDSMTGGDFTWGRQAPYGELLSPLEAISDTYSNRILLAYENNDYVQVGDYNTRVVPVVLAGFNANTNHYVYGLSSNNIVRLGGLLGVTQVGSSTYLTVQYDTGNIESTVSAPTNSFPVYFQQVTDGVKFAPTLGWYNYSANSYFAYRPDAMEFVGRYQDFSWHLLAFGSPPINPIIQNVSAYYIGKQFMTGKSFSQ